MQAPYRHDIKFLLSRRIRRVLMCILIALFCIASPIIILYSAGFGYDFVHHRITHTGVLSIDVLPEDARVFLGGIYIDKKLPIRLANRPPGIYNLKIEKTGYLPWEKNITIDRNQTTYIKDVTLIKHINPSPIASQIKHIIEIAGSPYAKNILILSKIDGIYEITAFDITKNSMLAILRSPTDKKPDISISPFHNTAYVSIEEHTEKILYIISLDAPQNAHIFSFKKETELDIMWNTNELEPLYIREEDTIQKINLSNNLEIYGQSTSSLWFVDTKGDLWIYHEKRIQNTKSGISYYLDTIITKIMSIADNYIITQTDTDTLIINRETENTYMINGLAHYFNRETNEWWIWTPWELTSIYEDGGMNLLYRDGEKITDIQLLDPSGLILISSEHTVKSFNSGYHVGNELFSYPVPMLYINIEERMLIGINPQDGKLYSSVF